MSALTDRLDEWAALAEKATPGPWEHGDRWSVCGVREDLFGEGRCSSCRDGDKPTWVGRRPINGHRMLAHVHTRDKAWGREGINAVRDSGPVAVVIETDEYGTMSDSDAAFIAASRTALPAAIAALRVALVECDRQQANLIEYGQPASPRRVRAAIAAELGVRP